MRLQYATARIKNESATAAVVRRDARSFPGGSVEKPVSISVRPRDKAVPGHIGRLLQDVPTGSPSARRQFVGNAHDRPAVDREVAHPCRGVKTQSRYGVIDLPLHTVDHDPPACAEGSGIGDMTAV